MWQLNWYMYYKDPSLLIAIYPDRKKAINLELKVWILVILYKHLKHSAQSHVRRPSYQDEVIHSQSILFTFSDCCVWLPSKQMHETLSLANKEEIGLTRWGVARCLLNLILIRLSKKTWQSLSGQNILYKYLTNLQLKKDVYGFSSMLSFFNCNYLFLHCSSYNF